MLNRNIIVLLVAGIAVVSAGAIGNPVEVLRAPQQRSQSCSNDWSGHIIGGHTAEPGQFPHQISLRLVRFMHVCGGSILSERWIVTAAHCTDGWSLDLLSIVAGAHEVYGDGVDYRIEQIINHPEYDHYYLYNDISMVRLSESLVLSERIAIIGYGTATPVGVGIAARSSGWGSDQPAGQNAQLLQFIDLITLSNIDCRSRHSQWSYWVTDNTLCAFSMKIGQGMCQGDSGGPLVVDGQLAGIVSWGDPCALGRPDAFTRVSNYVDWITEHINS